MKNNIGFTLVELLIAIAVFGIISVISVQGLYDIVSIRAKQQSIEDSSDSFRIITRMITKSVVEAERVDVANASEIRTSNDNYCQTIKYDSGLQTVLQAKVFAPCTVADTGFMNVVNNDFIITSFTLSPVDNSVDVVFLKIEGYYKNSLSDHPLEYETTISKRV